MDNAQPAKGVLAVRRIKQRQVARTCDFSEGYVGRVLNGREKPSRRFRRSLADLLELPERELFADDAA